MITLRYCISDALLYLILHSIIAFSGIFVPICRIQVPGSQRNENQAIRSQFACKTAVYGYKNGHGTIPEILSPIQLKVTSETVQGDQIVNRIRKLVP